MPRLAVAGVAVRALAESARTGGFDVVGLDVFGDRDTRAACIAWQRIGAPASLALDPVLLRSALAGLAADGRTIGWVPGGGFEADPSLLDAGGDALPCFGMDAGAVRRLRDPRAFFAALDRYRLPYPETRFQPPARPEGWLAKRAGGSGGLQVRVAPADAASGAGIHWQRQVPGTPMSALFLADGRRGAVVALNRLRTQAIGACPFVYAGALGPIRSEALGAAVDAALAALVPAFGLRGLASLDFVADGDVPLLLEINPRPSASMQLHDDACAGGLVRAHVDALAGQLPAVVPGRGVRGCRVVFAEHAVHVDEALSRALAALGCRDIPMPGTAIEAGEPACSVDARAGTADAVEAALAGRAAAVRRALEGIVEPTEESIA